MVLMLTILWEMLIFKVEEIDNKLSDSVKHYREKLGRVAKTGNA